ncbi:transcription factor SPT20 homolog [Drosophila virilis]|uniref:transcription factor SPT20 homolog n=1 Tax=Drosophila virilis TaxID=7244 RepID=UPI0038B25E40
MLVQQQQQQQQQQRQQVVNQQQQQCNDDNIQRQRNVQQQRLPNNMQVNGTVQQKPPKQQQRQPESPIRQQASQQISNPNTNPNTKSRTYSQVARGVGGVKIRNPASRHLEKLQEQLRTEQQQKRQQQQHPWQQQEHYRQIQQRHQEQRHPQQQQRNQNQQQRIQNQQQRFPSQQTQQQQQQPTRIVQVPTHNEQSQQQQQHQTPQIDCPLMRALERNANIVEEMARKLILEPFIPVRLLRPRYTEQLDRCMAPLRQQQLTQQREVAEERLPTLLQLEEDEQEAERRAAMLAEWEQRRAMGPPKRFDECTINMLRRKLKAGTITRENLMLLIDNQPPQIQWLILPELQHEHLQRQHQELIRTAEPAPGAIIQSAIDTDELQLERSLDMLEQALGQEMDEALIIAGNNIHIEMQQRLADNESVQLNTNELQMQHGQRLCGSSTNNTNATNTNNVNNDNDSDFDNDEFELFLSTYLQKKAELNPSLYSLARSPCGGKTIYIPRCSLRLSPARFLRGGITMSIQRCSSNCSLIRFLSGGKTIQIPCSCHWICLGSLWSAWLTDVQRRSS